MGDTSTRRTLRAAEHDKLRKAAQAKKATPSQIDLPSPGQQKQKTARDPNLPLGQDRRRKKKKGSAGQTSVKGKRAA
jgi:hypothetical protein